MRTFFRELRRRRVYQVAIGYAIGASATVQLIGTVLPIFHTQDWVQQIFVVLIALGFPVALALGWIFDLRLSGLRKTTVAGVPQTTDHRRLWILTGTGLLIAGIALAGYWLWHPWTRHSRDLPVAELPRPETSAAPVILEKSVAVLPFLNASEDKTNAQLVDGIHDEILTDLAKVRALKVISRTSTTQYPSGAKRNLRAIGQALGAAHIVEGTVQRDGQRVRVNVQLIDARTDIHMWAERYDRDLSNIFALESELAEKIVAQLEAQLSPEERALIEEEPTSDPIAHELFLRADALISASVFNVQGTDNLFQAADLLEKAVARDPKYFLAYCRLASVHDQIYLVGPDHTPARLALAEAAIRTAQRLRPEAGETHLALAEHLYCGFLDYGQARQELEIARQSLPNEPLIFELAGFIDRREGKWEDSTRNLARALELDPRNVYTLQQLAGSYQFLRRFAEAATILDRALAILPNDSSLRISRATLDLHGKADPQPLHAVIQAIVADDPRAATGFADEWLDLALCERDSAGAAQALNVMSDEGASNQGVVFSRAWCEGLVARMRGNEVAERAAFEKARAEVEKNLRDEPDQSQLLCILGMIDAALGRNEKAIHEGRTAVELLPVSKDSINGALVAEYLAVTYAWAGEKDQAIDQLRAVMQVPGEVSYGQLRLHPFWDPLRGDARFEQIVASQAPASTDR